MVTTTLSPSPSPARQLDLRVLGSGPLVHRELRHHQWMVRPIELETTPIPAWALARYQQFTALGMRPVQLLVAHELRARPLGKYEVKARQFLEQARAQPWLAAGALIGVSLIANVLFQVTHPATPVVVSAASGVATSGTLATAAVGTAVILAADPILIAVVADESGQGYTWWEVARWDD